MSYVLREAGPPVAKMPVGENPPGQDEYDTAVEFSRQGTPDSGSQEFGGKDADPHHRIPRTERLEGTFERRFYPPQPASFGDFNLCICRSQKVSFKLPP